MTFYEPPPPPPATAPVAPPPAAPAPKVVQAYAVESTAIGAGESLGAAAEPVELAAADPLLGATLDGEPVHLSDYRGRGLLVVRWSSACIPCRVDLQRLQEFDHRFRLRGLEVVAVNIADRPAAVARLVAQRTIAISYALVVNSENTAPAPVPHATLYDLEGRVAAEYRDHAGIDLRTLDRDIERILPAAR